MEPYQHTSKFARAGWTGWFPRPDRGRLRLTGGDALEFLQALVTNDVAGLKDNRGLYALLCRPDGGVVDDLYIYRLDAERFLVIANASRAADDRAWLEGHLGPETKIEEQPQPAALALQGPRAAEILRNVVPEILTLRKHDVVECPVLDRDLVVARTGYTGEDGFEFFGPAGHLLPLHHELLRGGAALGLASCGLGAVCGGAAGDAGAGSIGASTATRRISTANIGESQTDNGVRRASSLAVRTSTPLSVISSVCSNCATSSPFFSHSGG